MTLHNKMLSLHIFASLLLVLIMSMGWFGINNLLKSEKSIEHTLENIQRINRLERVVIDMETGVRGYVVANDDVFLEPYQKGLSGYPKLFNKIKADVQDNPLQVENIEKLQASVDNWVKTISNPIVSLPNDQAKEFISSGVGKKKMDTIRESIQEFRGIEEDLLVIRRKDSRVAATSVTHGLWTVTATVLVLTSVTSYLISRNILAQVGGEPGEIAAVTQKIAKGNLDIETTEPCTGIFGSVIEMTHALKENQKLINSQNQKLKEANESLEGKVKERTEELERSNKDLEQFAYIASHDLKAPLRAVTNLASWIVEEIDAPTDKLLEYTSLLQGRVQRMDNLINGILEFSRVGRFNVEKDWVDLNHVVQNIAVPETFKVESDDLPQLYVNEVRATQIFENLINNAVKHHDKEKGNIEITHKETPESHVICVIDDGPGIDEQYHEKIFQIFQTLKPKDEVEATGIGLTIVKRIMEEQGGGISLESTGRGCAFTLTFRKEGHEFGNSTN